MVKLSELAADYIDCITSFLSGHDIGKLWLCGDAQLIGRLSQGGVTKFDLKLTSRAKIVFPQLVSSMYRLRTMKLGYCENMPWIDIPAFTWSWIPTWLVELDIRIKTPVVLNEIVFPRLESFSISWNNLAVVPELNGRDIIPNLRVATPHLKALLVNPNRSPERPTLHLAQLPTGLTSLTGQYTQVVPVQGLDYHWPPGLTTLNLILERLGNVWAHFPPSLVHLSCYVGDGGRFVADKIDWTLAHLPHLLSLGIPSIGTTTKQISQLPDQLTSLELFDHFSGSSAAIVAALPNDLTRYRGYPCRIGDELAPKLPKSLKDATLQIAAPSALALLPQSFTTLSAQTVLQNPLLALPLVKLELTSAKGLTSFPATLRSLSTRDLHLELLHALPAGLTSLVVKQIASTEAFELLPRGLLNFACSSATGLSLKKSSLASMPRSLTHLELSFFQFENPAWFQGAPEELKVLRLHAALDISPAMISPLRDSALEFLSLDLDASSYHAQLDAFLPVLPQRLISLGLTFTHAGIQSGLRNSDLIHLPRSLVYLQLPESPAVTSACKSLLPPYLLRVSAFPDLDLPRHAPHSNWPEETEV